MTPPRRLILTGLLLATAAGLLQAQRSPAPAPPAADPVMLIETAKGAIAIQLFRSGAPKTVDHIIALVNRSFYRAQRIHRVNASLVQFGDPASRDMSRRDHWGTGGSGTRVGVAEFIKGRTHRRGAVGLAHAGNPANADSQLYIMKTASPSLDGKHVVLGQVTSGMEVVDKLAVTDMLKNVSMKK
jgi:cyclophilin family peptidyl-prolyl cis-trans isomerase